jgi:hypothetical protein
MTRITIRLTVADIEALKIIKGITHNDSDTEAIRFALGEFKKTRPSTEEFMKAYQPKTSLKNEIPKDIPLEKIVDNSAIEVTVAKILPKDPNPYLLISKGWNHELGEHTKIIKQNLKPWHQLELLESQADFYLYNEIGKPKTVEIDDVQTL